ncbi:hypothetical protein [Desmospora profundinema]|uniref:Cytochrome P450 n=1 Tax=Desmospora profundinema TaxID=1571184 RepID=A0ABU1IK40_9BACL|nr:hypothetical protein [Desmospora profundinema]MDR6225128.1 hypothetical protein [Desmospora profundinema]
MNAYGLALDSRDHHTFLKMTGLAWNLLNDPDRHNHLRYQLFRYLSSHTLAEVRIALRQPRAIQDALEHAAHGEIPAPGKWMDHAVQQFLLQQVAPALPSPPNHPALPYHK